MTGPLVSDVPGAPPPEEIFGRSGDRPWLLWLDSGPSRPSAANRFSYLAVDPFRVLRGLDGRAEWVLPEGVHPAAADPLTELEICLDSCRFEETLPPFCGGAAGFLGYELAGELEVLPRPAHRDLSLPDMELAFYDLVVGWDRVEDRCWIASTGRPADGARGHHVARRRLRRAEEWLAGGPPPAEHDLPLGSGLPITRTASPAVFPVPLAPGVRSTFSPEAYGRAVQGAIEWIRAGDVYQVNLSQRFETTAVTDAGSLYRRLRHRSPAPFGAFFRAAGGSVLSSSPERFLRVEPDGRVETRPIKGTRPRDPDPATDEALAAQLGHSVKDRAENLMIVDLLRNDLSRVCGPGSVRATELFRIESYATVHHLVSTIEGRLSGGRGRVDLLRAAFPSGSVTGAPKIRAMEIISELEPVARGPYCGAIGFLGFGGDMDTSVSIRIAVAAGGRIAFHAGGAVVADSDPGAEYAETLDKARALLEVIGGGHR